MVVVFPHCHLFFKLEYWHRSKISYPMAKNQDKKINIHNTDLRSVFRGNMSAGLSCIVLTSCMLTPGSL